MKHSSYQSLITALLAIFFSLVASPVASAFSDSNQTLDNTSLESPASLIPAAFVAGELKLEPSKVKVNVPVSISFDVKNIGDVDGTYEAMLRVNGEIVETKSVNLAGGTGETVEFTLVESKAGKYIVSIDDHAETLLVIEESPSASTLDQPVLYERGPDWDDYVYPNGTHERKLYPGLMNYWNGSGYEPIDTSIVRSGDTFYVEKGAYKFYWAMGEGLRLEKDGELLTYTSNYLSYPDANGTVTMTGRDVLPTVEDNKILFQDVFDGIDVEYIYLNDWLKRNVILRSPPQLNASSDGVLEFAGEMGLPGDLEVWADDANQGGDFVTSGGIVFKKGNETVYYLMAPYVYDSNGSAISAEYEIKRSGDKDMLSVKVPMSWLTNSSRVYPVVIDPSVNINPLADACVYQIFPWENYGIESYLFLNTLNGYIARDYLKFDLDDIPSGSTIDLARLYVYRYSGVDDRIIDVHSVSDDSWSEGGITWWNKPSYGSRLDYVYSDYGWNVWYITSQVRNELSGDKKISLMLRDRYDGSWSTYRQWYYSKEGSYSPFLYVTYTPPLPGVGPDEYEDDDYYWRAKPISPGDKQSRTIHDGGADIDWAKFTISSKSEVTIETSGPSGDTRMWLYDSNLNQIAYNDDGGAGYWSKIVKTLSPGTYYIKIDEYDNNNEIPTYYLELTATPVELPPYEPDDYYWQAKEIKPGETQTRNILDGGADIDWIYFILDSEYEVTVETSGPSGDTRMWLYDSSGVPTSYIAYNDDGGAGLWSKIVKTLQPGTYYIKIDEYNNNDEIPTYYLTLTAVKVDWEKPSVWVSGAPSTWQNWDASASVSCSDDESGCDTSMYRLKIYSYEPATCPTNHDDYPLSSPQTISDNAWVCAAAKDNADNPGFSTPVEFKVDKIKPFSIIASPPAGSQQSSDFEVFVSDSDTGGSGLDIGEYKVVSNSVTTRDWTARTLSSSVTITVGPTGDCRDEGTNTCTVYVRAEDNAGNTGSEDSRSFSISIGPVNTDGDDLADEEEDALAKVMDAMGNEYPNKYVADAYYPLSASKMWFEQTKQYLQTIDYKDLSSGELGNRAMFLAKLYQKSDDPTLKNEIKPILENMLSEIMSRQEIKDVYKLSLKGILNIKGNIYAKHGSDKFEYGNPVLDTGSAGMALLEGYNALKNDDYKERGLLAADFTVRWLESRGFDSDGEDEFFPSIGYADEAEEEKNQKGGDEFLSTANNYGTALNVIALASNITKDNYYVDRARWASDEVKRLQKSNGGIRDGPLAPHVEPFIMLGWSRLTEQIKYAGMTAFGIRQAFDVTKDSNADEVAVKLANHYDSLRSQKDIWPYEWSFEKNSVVVEGDQVEASAWASVIKLSGNHLTGFRQAVVDGGGFSNIGNSFFSLTLYQALKDSENQEIVFVKESANKRTSTSTRDTISQGSKKVVDAEVGTKTAVFRISWASSGSDLDLVLYEPDGTKIDPNVAAGDPSITYVESSTYEYYVIQNPAHGTWQMEITAVATPAEGEEFNARVVLDTALITSLSTNMERYRQNEAVSILLQAKKDGVAFTGAGASAKIEKPDGTVSSMLLYDDGTHGDVQANDGFYTNTFTETSEIGLYKLNTTISGTIDGESFSREDTRTFEVIDTTPPTIEIVEPSNNSFLPTRNVSVKWNGSDDYGGVFYIIIVDENPWNVTNATEETISNLSEGLHSVRIVASDAYGNLDFDSINFTVDATPPNITITGIENGSYYYTNVSALINITDIHLNTTIVTLNGAPYVSGANISEGDNYLLEVFANDSAGNNASANVTFTIDKTPPFVEIISPANNSYIKGIVEILGNASDANLANFSLSIEGDVVSNTTTFAWNTSNYAEGSHVVEVYAADNAGNEATETITVTIDNTPPTIEITSPANNSYIATKEVTINWNASDNFGIASYEIILDDTPSVITTETSVTLSNLTEGLHNVEVRAFDLANNSASAFVSFTVDTLPPEISITGVEDGAYYNGDVSVNIEVSDANLNSTLTLLNDTPYASGTTITEEGVYVLEVYADDLAGNAAFANLTFVIDKTPPEVNLTSPVDGSFVKGIIEITGAATDVNLDAVFLRIDGDEVTNVLPYAWDTLDYSDGAHIIELTAIDKANNTASANVTVYVDNTPPSISIAFPLAQDYSYTEDITIDFNITDDGSGVAWHKASLDGSEVVSGQIIDLFNFTLGEHDLTIEAADNLGNNATATVTFNVIDDVPPVIVIIEPEAGEYASVEDITVNFTANDEKSGLASVTALLDGSPVANGQSIDLASLDLGEHVLTVTAIDNAGNAATETVAFTVNPTQVEIRVTPVSKNVKEDNNFDFIVHVRSEYDLSKAAGATTATFAEGYTTLAVLGGEQLNIKVDVGTLESRDYSFTLTSIGEVKVTSNTVNVTVFVPSEKGKGKADNSTVKGKATSTKGKGKSEEKGKGKDKDKDDKGSESGGLDDDSGGDSGGGDSGSQAAGNQGQGKGKGKDEDKGNQGQGNENSNAGGNKGNSGNQGGNSNAGGKDNSNSGNTGENKGQGNSNGGGQGQGNANSGEQSNEGSSSQGQGDSNSGSGAGDSSGQGSASGSGNDGGNAGSGGSNSGGQGQGNGGNSGESNSNAGESSEGSQGNAKGDQGGNSGDSASGSSNSGTGSEDSSSGGESSSSGDSGNPGGSGASDSSAESSSGGGQGNADDSEGGESSSGNSGNSGSGNSNSGGNGNSNGGGQGNGDNSGNSGSSKGNK